LIIGGMAMKKISITTVVFLISIFFVIPLVRGADDSELISLDLKGMDIRDVLKILAQKSGLNIVADSDVKGMVTVYLKDVNAMDAIDIIASINNLAYVRDGMLIRVIPGAEYEKIYGSRFGDKTVTEIIKLNYAVASEAAKVIAEMRSGKGKVIADDASNTVVVMDFPENIKKMKSVISQMDVLLVTEIFPLDYAKAESVKDKIESMISKGVGSIRFDEKTNKLVVKDTPQKIEDVRRIIKAFDEKTREVLIDANIVQVTLSDKYSYGIDWADIAKLGDIKLTGDTNLSTGLSNVTPTTLSIATTGGKYSTIISLLKTYGRTDVLSRPRITVLDKQEAKILVGAKEVYVTSNITTTSGGTYNTSDNVQFVDVGVRLAVVPEINRAGFVTLKIKPEVSSADATKTVILKNPDGSTRTVVPYVTTSEAETAVIVKDGTTIIIGGLMKDTLIGHKEKVPFLGEIPLVGKLFSTTGKSKEKTEIVIFLTPHIIEGDETTDEAAKYLDEWENKTEEKPKLAKLDIEKKEDKKQAPAFKKGQAITAAKTKPKVKVAAKHKEGQKPKWIPILGAKPEYVKRPAVSETIRDSAPVKTPYEEYYLTLRQEINDIARRDTNVRGIPGEVELQFTLDSEGFLVSGPVVLNKPDLRLVRSAVSCVKKSSPFPKFPKEMKKEEVEFSVVVRYE